MAELAGFTIERRDDGATVLSATGDLPPYPRRVTDRLVHWAAVTPDVTFLAEKDGDGWRRLTYAAALDQARAIGQALLDRELSAERPVLILSGNGIEHALLAMACQHVGVLYAPISAANSGANSDLVKLRQIVALTTPGLIFALGTGFRRALDAVLPEGCETLDSLDALLQTKPTEAVDAAYTAIDGDTVAKLLFTSGSTGTRPKAVITTHRMLCANQSMMKLGFGYLLGDEKLIMVDWLPWSHTFGGSHNFNMVLFEGGTMYLDAGRPLPGQFGPTLDAIREVAPTLYLAVPKAWEELARAMRADPTLNRRFHERLRVRFYAAAALSQPLWDELDALAAEATDHELPMITGLGSTETAPMGTCTDGSRAGRAGDIGMPVPGITLKMVPTDGKLELRVSGPCITPG
ncbi:MAG: AMP-binding protein, partial [Janthinobacterium lividum]